MVFCFFSLVIEMKNHSLLFYFLPYVWTPDTSFKSTWEEVEEWQKAGWGAASYGLRVLLLLFFLLGADMSVGCKNVKSSH